MNCISIIPKNTEIRCRRRKRCEASYGLIGIRISLRIGVLRYAPDAFDGGIFADQLLYQIHIRSFGSHGYIDHFNSEMLCDSKMSVISGNRAQKLYMIQFTPGGISQNAMGHGTGYRIIHDGQTGITAYDHVLWFYLQNIRHQLLCLRNAIQTSVVSHIHSILSLHSALRIHSIQKIHCHIQLIDCRFSSGHIQFQAFAFCIFICSVKLCLQC